MTTARVTRAGAPGPAARGRGGPGPGRRWPVLKCDGLGKRPNLRIEQSTVNEATVTDELTRYSTHTDINLSHSSLKNSVCTPQVHGAQHRQNAPWRRPPAPSCAPANPDGDGCRHRLDPSHRDGHGTEHGRAGPQPGWPVPVDSARKAGDSKPGHGLRPLQPELRAAASALSRGHWH